MKLLFENFDLLAESPGGIKKLREMILQFAVQGKLVPQDPNDEPTSVLLEKIRVEKERLVKDGKIKKQKELEPIQQDEIPYEIPHKWKWCRIRSISHDWGQKKPDSDFTYIDVTSINKEKGIIGENTQLLDGNSAPSRARKIVQEGTVIYSTVRPYLLNIAIIEKDYLPEPIASTAFAIVHPLGKIENRYLYYYFRSIPFVNYVESKMIGMAYPAINDANFFKGLIPLPPIPEQKRIVSKVDSLMALCDELEKQQKENALKNLTLNKASLHTLHNSTTKQNFTKNWNHITNNFDLLYSTPENVKELKQTILQLAVQGKLVFQDSKEGEIIISDLEKEREQLFKQNFKNKKYKSPVKIDIKGNTKGVDALFDLPSNWSWVSLGQITWNVSDGPHFSPKYTNEGIPIISSRNISFDNGINFNTAKYVSYSDYKSFIQRGKPTVGDVILSKGGTTGVPAVITEDKDFCIWVHLALLKLISSVDSFYLRYTLASPLVYKQSQIQTHGIGNKDLGLTRMVYFAIPLPPLAEQKRIVAKVDSLMALCDRLGENLSDKEKMSGKMLSAVVSGL